MKPSAYTIGGSQEIERPNKKANDGDGDAGSCDEGITEDGLARKRGNDFADHAHRRKNHDVHGGMRIEPEKVLEENRIAAQRGIEEPEMEHALETGEQ